MVLTAVTVEVDLRAGEFISITPDLRVFPLQPGATPDGVATANFMAGEIAYFEAAFNLLHPQLPPLPCHVVKASSPS